jgi:hypothetical protein
MRPQNRPGMQSIGDILSELFARRGYARMRSQDHLEQAWREAVGEPGANYTRVGWLRRGVLDIYVANSVLLQELAGFQQEKLLSKLQQTLRSDEIRAIRFRLDDSLDSRRPGQ